MSCGIDDKSCETPRRRGALAVLGLMTGIFVVLSYLSFVPTRGQVTPDTVSFADQDAIAGKRVFQAYNCMGCHTLVGNGAYLGPDLTNIYEDAGAAWLAAFLPSAGSWPTEAAVRTQLLDAAQQADSGVDSIEAYLARYPGAASRVSQRGGNKTIMPNLPINKEEVTQLIAYLKYTSAMNTEGWPPKVRVNKAKVEQVVQKIHGAAVPAATAAVTTATPDAAPQSLDPVVRGEQLVKEYACTACHATDKTTLIGPGWGGLYGAMVDLVDGSQVTADDSYLAESITDPDAKVVAGFPVGVMQSYAALLSTDDVNAIVAYLRTLEKQ